jgi:hypothetical protein
MRLFVESFLYQPSGVVPAAEGRPPQRRRLLILLLPLLLWAACSKPKRDIRDYYFPADQLLDGRVYAYDLLRADSSAPEYWYFRTFRRDSGLFLASTYYNQFFQVGQQAREKLVETGALARDYYLYEPDTATGGQIQVAARLEGTSIFPFEVRDSNDVFLFSLKYHPANDTSTTIYLIRNRRFLGDGPPFEFNGRDYPTVRFALREAVGNENIGSSEIEGTGEEWYAKGLGLVYFRKKYGEQQPIIFEYKLDEIFDMEELEQRAEKMFK